MASHAGVFYFDGREASGDIPGLVAGLRPMAPDGVTSYSANGIAMAHGAMHVWSRDASARQPLRSARGLVMTWDGRLDNRDDLMLRLGGRLQGDASDAAIALAAFERWDNDGLRSLVGEWSLAVWDPANRTVHLARDYMGIRPLYYCIGAHALMWSSSLGELALRSGRADDFDEVFVARFMALRFSTEVTPYRGIRGVPTATWVSVSADGREGRRRYWSLAPGLVRYRDARQYDEQLRSLWMDAVGARLQVAGTAWAELSGGLDSSAVVCMADELVRARRVPAHTIAPISFVALHSPEADERRFIAEVEKHTDTASAIVAAEECLDVCGPDWWVSPVAPQGVQVACAQTVRQHGGRLILSGRMGDAVMGCEPDNSIAVFDDVCRGDVIATAVKLRQWSRACRKPFVHIALALVREVLRSQAGRTELHSAGMGLLTTRLALKLPQQRAPQVADHVVRLAHRRIAVPILGYALDARLEVPAESCGVTYAFPFAHRPLVEFVTAIPSEELSAPGQTRALMRRALAGVVPDRILRRLSKGYYPPAALRAMRARLASMPTVGRLEIVQRGWVDASRLSASIRRLFDSGADAAEDVQLAMRLEDWLKSRDRRGPAGTPQRKEVTNHAVFIA